MEKNLTQLGNNGILEKIQKVGSKVFSGIKSIATNPKTWKFAAGGALIWLTSKGMDSGYDAKLDFKVASLSLTKHK